MNSIYLIGNKNVGLYKIGVAKTPQNRLKTNQTSCPFELEIIHVFQSKYAYKIEKILHKDFISFKKDENDNNIQGEWFCLNSSQVEEFVDRCKTHENNFNILLSLDNYHFNKFLRK